MATDIASYVLTFSPEESSSGDVTCTLEQRDANGDETWDECFNRRQGYYYDDDGFLVGTPNTTMQKTWDDIQYCNEIYCNEDGSFSVDVLVTITPSDTPYKVVLSHGTIGEMQKTDIEYTESVSVESKDELILEFNIPEGQTVEASWEGEILNMNGDVLPTLDIYYDESEQRLYWGESVVSTIRVQTKRQVDLYPVNIPPRSDTTESSAFSSTFRAFYNDEEGDSQVASLDISEPTVDGKCGEYVTGGGSSTPTEEKPTQEKCQKEKVYIDGCTGEVLRREYTTVPCPEDEE